MRTGFGFALVVALALSNSATEAAEVQARLERSNLTVGESTPLEIIVKGASLNIGEPQFDVPDGLQVLASSRQQNFSWLNGKGSTETVFRFEIAPIRAGIFTVGPIRIKVGDQFFQSEALTLNASAERRHIGSSGEGPATLEVDVTPREPYVGQPVIMRVRLVQRAPLAEDPRYSPPATPGFWAERPSEPESYYAAERGARVLVTETRTRLYPLAAGRAQIGEGEAALTLALPGGFPDPLQWLGGRQTLQREVTARSAPVGVHVRPLPPGAPAGFDGAVGSFSVTWTADRQRTSQDVPITVRLSLRGLGNLPLLHSPPLQSRDFEVFASTVEDSLPPPGSMAAGRRRFQWTVLPRRQGTLDLSAPAFAWFDPTSGTYKSVELPPLSLVVGSPVSPAASPREAFPAVFAEHSLDPFRRGSEPWAFAVAGLALGMAWRLWRRATRLGPGAVERARQREWLQTVGFLSGMEFWRAADRACDWLEARGMAVPDLRRDIAASRFGGSLVDIESVRRRLIERISRAQPAGAPWWLPRVGAVALAGAAAALCVLLGPQGGGTAGVVKARAADQAARAGDLGRARAQWTQLWEQGGREAGLAARLAWEEESAGAIGPASLWVLRGDRGEPRDPALTWVVGQIREAGGLTGYVPSRVPLRRNEWAILALVFALGAVVVWPQRLWAVLLLLSLPCSALYPIQSWWAQHTARGVVLADVKLEGTDLELEPGQVLTVLQRAPDRVHASVGRGVSGWLPKSAIATAEQGS